MASNEEILRRNEQIRKLQESIATPEEKRTRPIEKDFEEAFQALSGVKATKKDLVLDSSMNLRERKAMTIRLLNMLIRKPFYGKQADKYKDQIEEKEKKKEEETKAISQQQQAKTTQKLSEETTRLAQPATGETTRLAPVTSKETIALPETDDQRIAVTGDTIVQSKTGQTIRQAGTPPQPDDQYVMYTPPTIAVPYAAARMTPGIKKTTVVKDPSKSEAIQARLKNAEIETKKKLEQIKRGDFGARLQQEALKDEQSVSKRVQAKEERRAFVNMLNQTPELAEDYNGVYEPITSAIALQKATEKHLAKQGLIDTSTDIEGDAKFRQFVDGEYGKTQNDRIMSGFAPDVTPSLQQYTSASVPVRRQVLTEYFQQNSTEQNPYAINVTNRLSSITQRLGLGQKTVASEAKTAVTTKLKDAGIKQLEKQAGRRLAASAIAKFASGLATGGAGWVISLIPTAFRFVRKHLGEIAPAAIALTLLGGMMGSLAIGGLGIGLLGLSVLAGGTGLVIAGVGATIAGVVGFMFSIVFSAIFIPIIISFVTVIALLVFILFIINNSGYVTPYAPELAVVQDANSNQSFNIQVTKRAVSGSEFNNGPFPVNVEYEVKITALNEDLTNITFNNAYTITQQPQTASQPNPTIPTNARPSDTPPNTITKGNTYTLTYTTSYPDTFKDSYVCDTFEVSANAGSTRDSSSGTACITIGKSPVQVSCPSGWPVRNSGLIYGVNQGPHTKGVVVDGSAGSHPYEEVDIGLHNADGSVRLPTSANEQDVIMATHNGTIQAIVWHAPTFGNYIEISSVCNGIRYVSWYGHMRDVEFGTGLQIGHAVIKGTKLGLVGETGCSSGRDCPSLGYHIHYGFYTGLAGKEGIQMGLPYIPVSYSSINHCIGFPNCGSIIVRGS